MEDDAMHSQAISRSVIDKSVNLAVHGRFTVGRERQARRVASSFDRVRAKAFVRCTAGVEMEISRASTYGRAMSNSSERLERIEAHLAHVERQYEQLNEVVIEQGRALARLQKENTKVSQAVETMELERIRANNPKPPHYGS
jgi:uncharacterized coiled-coil protein SlyX